MIMLFWWYHFNKKLHPPVSVLSSFCDTLTDFIISSSTIWRERKSLTCNIQSNFFVITVTTSNFFNNSIVTCLLVSHIAKNKISVTREVETNSDHGLLLSPLSRRCITVPSKGFPDPTLVPYDLWVVRALQTLSGIEVIVQHLFSHLIVNGIIGRYVLGIW